ncbi:MAG: helix-turn-helix domain-containing protein [Candidatus Hydrogenedens sp.]|nr:helix-turn-helix domain-containing protein [Candidatus Hydrogenedens sp.]
MTTNTRENQLLTVKEVAAKIGLSVRSVWNARDAGAIPAPVRIMGSTRWRASDIQAWIDDGCPNVRRTRWEAK